MSDIATNLTTFAARVATEFNTVRGEVDEINTSLSEQISTNATSIATNAANIATNTSNIATNTTNIATNASDIDALESAMTTAQSDIEALETEAANHVSYAEAQSLESAEQAQARSNIDALGTTETAAAATADASGNVITDTYATKSELEELEESLASVYDYKGSVDTYDDLPTDAETGDVYNVTDTGMNYAWTGTEWDALGSIYDLSGYATKEELEAYTQIDDTTASTTSVYSSSKTEELISAIETELSDIGDLATVFEASLSSASTETDEEADE